MDAKELSPRPSLEQYKKQAKDLVKARKSGDPEALRRIKQHHPRLGKLSDAELRSAKFALADAQFTIAREHHFESWAKFAKHLEALKRKNSAVAQFEAAVEAVITGGLTTLERLLRQNPKLIRARSTRKHRATLLHYVGANGIEGFRQKTPKNAVKVAEILLKAGAEVDAMAEIYGGSTTLGLVATSIHPMRAGVQNALIQTLLDYGAGIDHPGAAGNGHFVVNGCLANGRGEAAVFLARRGARLDLEGAAGVGRLDLVNSFFNENGSLKASATKAQMEAGFAWACEYGRNSVIDFLLKRGVDLRAQANIGETGLHWAVVGGQLDTIKLLLERGAPLEEKNVYGGTALSQALWSAINGDPGIDYVPIIETLIEAGAKIEDGSLAWLAQQEGRSSSARARIAEVLRRHGAKS